MTSNAVIPTTWSEIYEALFPDALVEFLVNPAAVGSAGLAAQRLAIGESDIDRLAACFVRALEEAIGRG